MHFFGNLFLCTFEGDFPCTDRSLERSRRSLHHAAGNLFGQSRHSLETLLSQFAGVLSEVHQSLNGLEFSRRIRHCLSPLFVGLSKVLDHFVSRVGVSSLPGLRRAEVGPGLEGLVLLGIVQQAKDIVVTNPRKRCDSSPTRHQGIPTVACVDIIAASVAVLVLDGFQEDRHAENLVPHFVVPPTAHESTRGTRKKPGWVSDRSIVADLQGQMEWRRGLVYRRGNFLSNAVLLGGAAKDASCETADDVVGG
mmetsp:Transcript_21512/g.50938  ORF Transcript_21512/g.50938 Transcript_21512/m.50938 type:complete len:251 (+) Transcript_21512:1484-2236(+)